MHRRREQQGTKRKADETEHILKNTRSTAKNIKPNNKNLFKYIKSWNIKKLKYIKSWKPARKAVGPLDNEGIKEKVRLQRSWMNSLNLPSLQELWTDTWA